VIFLRNLQHDSNQETLSKRIMYPKYFKNVSVISMLIEKSRKWARGFRKHVVGALDKAESHTSKNSMS